MERWIKSLQEIVNFALANFDQYRQVVTCSQLVTTLVTLLTTADQHLVEDVLAALKALAISGSGQQALIAAKACTALCQLLPTLAQPLTSGLPPQQRPGQLPSKKRQCLQRQDDDLPQAWVLAVQLLVTLLVEAQDRPGVGTLEQEAAAAAFESIWKVLSGKASWTEPTVLHAAAAALARCEKCSYA
eukprot:gene2386-2690_t